MPDILIAIISIRKPVLTIRVVNLLKDYELCNLKVFFLLLSYITQKNKNKFASK